METNRNKSRQINECIGNYFIILTMRLGFGDDRLFGEIRKCIVCLSISILIRTFFLIQVVCRIHSCCQIKTWGGANVSANCMHDAREQSPPPSFRPLTSYILGTQTTIRT